MPIIEIDRLRSDSSDAQVKAAISSCIATEVNNGRDQDQAVAMCYQMVRDKTGKELSPPKGEE